MPYKNTKAMVRSPDEDTDFFDIVAGVPLGDSVKSKVGNRSRGWPEDLLFNSYYSEV